MKKLLSILVIFTIVLVTGCSNTKTLTCTKELTDEDGYKTTTEMTITYNKEKVLTVDEKTASETDPEYVDFTYGFMNLFTAVFTNVDGIEVNVSKENNIIKTSMNIDYEKLDVHKIEENLSSMDIGHDDIYSTNDITFEEFKAKNLKGYTCK